MAEQLKLCANLTMMFKECGSLSSRYAAAKECGLKAVEVAFPYDTPLEELIQVKENNHLEQILINAYPGDIAKGDFGLAALPGREIDFERSLQLTFKYAEGLLCNRVHFMSGKILPESQFSRKECYKTLQTNLKNLVPILEQKGIVGLIEPINNYSVPNYILNDFDEALSIVESINSPFVRLQLDLFHLQQIHGNLTRRISDLLPYVGHIQIAQAPGRNEPDTPGEIDYQYILSYLQKLGYKGWIGMEYVPAGDTKEGIQWITKFGLNL